MVDWLNLFILPAGQTLAYLLQVLLLYQLDSVLVFLFLFLLAADLFVDFVNDQFSCCLLGREQRLHVVVILSVALLCNNSFGRDDTCVLYCLLPTRIDRFLFQVIRRNVEVFDSDEFLARIIRLLHIELTLRRLNLFHVGMVWRQLVPD